MDKEPFTSAIEQICEEKGIVKERVIETIEMALAAAYKKEHNRKGQNIKVKFNSETGQMKVFQVKLVVDQSMLKTEEEIEKELAEKEKSEPDKNKKAEEPEEANEEENERKIRFNPEKHIMVDEANSSKDVPKTGKKKKYEPGDEINFPLEVAHDFGRIAAQTAKQVIIQRIREAERETIYEEYKGKEGQVVSGVIQRIERDNVFLDIGKTTGILFPEDQIPNEHYRIGQRIKAYITEVQKDSRGPAITLSRTHPKMITQLFMLEVPEIANETVEIKSIAREAGSRSKIAVTSAEERIDPIGSMIGQKGTRVQAVINELAGEKIDIIEWSEDPVKFISQSLSPAKVIDVKIDKKQNQAKVIVPEDQLSLAIGAKGQNVRLAAKLTGWKIDIIAQKVEKEKAKTKKKEGGKDKKRKIEKKEKKKKEIIAEKKGEEKKTKKASKPAKKKSEGKNKIEKKDDKKNKINKNKSDSKKK